MSETSDETKRLLTQLAQRVQNKAELMASVLTRYQHLEQLNDQALAARLQTDALGLARLALCKRPAPDARFAEQVRQIAGYTNADASQVAQVIRYIETIDALAQKPVTETAEESTTQSIPKWSGVVAAARDRDDTEAQNGDDNVAGPDESKRD